jgi:hypothetical protein
MVCPDTAACGAPLCQSDIRHALGGHADPRYQKFESLLLQRTLEAEGGLCYCPRPWCAKPSTIIKATEAVSLAVGRALDGPRGGRKRGGVTGFGARAGVGSSAADLARAASSVAVAARDMAICNYCGFAFCVECRRSAHGSAMCGDIVGRYMTADAAGAWRGWALACCARALALCARDAAAGGDT